MSEHQKSKPSENDFRLPSPQEFLSAVGEAAQDVERRLKAGEFSDEPDPNPHPDPEGSQFNLKELKRDLP